MATINDFATRIGQEVKDLLARVGPLEYDSGTYNIAGEMAGVTGGAFYVERVGKVVRLEVNALEATQSGVLFTLPVGLRPKRTIIWTNNQEFAATGPRILVGFNGTLNFVGFPTSDPAYASLTFLVRDTPPASMPGVLA